MELKKSHKWMARGGLGTETVYTSTKREAVVEAQRISESWGCDSTVSKRSPSGWITNVVVVAPVWASTAFDAALKIIQSDS